MSSARFLLLPCLVVLGTSRVFGFAYIAEGELTSKITAGVTSDSRIQGSASGKGDTYVSLTPTLDFKRETGAIGLDANAGVNILRYSDLTILNREDLFGDARFYLAGGQGAITSADLDILYKEASDVDDFALVRQSSKTFTARLNSDLRLALKHLLSFSASYSDINRDTGADQSFYSAGLSHTYSDFLGDTSLITTYSFARTQSSGTATTYNLDSTSHSLSTALSRPLFADVVGKVSGGYRWLSRPSSSLSSGIADKGNGLIYSASIVGPFLPKKYFTHTDSSLSISYEGSESPGINDNGKARLVGSADVDWHMTDLRTLSLGISRSQALSSQNLTVVLDTVTLSLDQKIGLQMHGTIDTSYSHQTTQGAVTIGGSRKEDVVRGGLSLSYDFVQHYSASLRYSYENRDSTDVTRSYDRHIVSLSVTGTF